MRTGIVVGGMALVLMLGAAPAGAQVVQAGVVIRSGPVSGHVLIGDPGPVVYHHPARRVYVERYRPQVIVIRHLRAPHGRAHGWWRKHGYHPVVVYYDYRGGRYYDRWHRDRRGIREVVVYERGGRYYAWDDDDREGWRDREWDE